MKTGIHTRISAIGTHGGTARAQNNGRITTTLAIHTAARIRIARFDRHPILIALLS